MRHQGRADAGLLPHSAPPVCAGRPVRSAQVARHKEATMRTPIARRNLLKLGALGTVGGALASRVAGAAQAGETPGASGDTDTVGPSPRRMLEALKEAVRWPTPATPVILALTGEYLAAGRDAEAYDYFRERATDSPDAALFLALEGTFQLRMADRVFLLRRIAWVKDGIAKLDRAAETGHPVARYLRAVALAELPARFGRAETAVAELDWVRQQDGFPPGLRRSVYRALAKSFPTLERRAEAQAVLAQAGFPSLDPTLPQFPTDCSVSARDGFRFRPPRVVEVAPRVYVAQGYDFADIAFVLTETGMVAVDAGTTEATARAALD